MGRVRDEKNRASAVAAQRKTRASRALALARKDAREFASSMRRNQDPSDAVQDILDEIHGAWAYATQQVLQLTEDEYWVESLGIRVPHYWIREQERLANMVVTVAGRAASMGLAERMIRLEEAQAEIFSRAVEAALVVAGLQFDQRRKIHEAIAERLDDIEGLARDLPLLNAGEKAAA